MEGTNEEMIADLETNKLYLSKLLLERFPNFYNAFSKVLMESGIPIELLPFTKDVWAKDYMPIQVGRHDYIRFKYDPDYLKPEDEAHLRTNVQEVCEAIQLNSKYSPIILDGGNVVGTNKKVIMCDKVFLENPQLEKEALKKQLIELLQIEELIFVPWEGRENDYLGHADGMVRFIDEHTVLINDYHKAYLKKSISEAKLEVVCLPCHYTHDKESAIGYYLNFLQMEQALIVPTFQNKNPDRALRILEMAFPHQKIVPLASDEIAKQGGVLNCVSWGVWENMQLACL